MVLLVTSASGANCAGYGKLLAFDSPAALRGATASVSLELAFAKLTGRRVFSEEHASA